MGELTRLGRAPGANQPRALGEAPTLPGLSFPICTMTVIMLHLPHGGGCKADVT